MKQRREERAARVAKSQEMMAEMFAVPMDEAYEQLPSPLKRKHRSEQVLQAAKRPQMTSQKVLAVNVNAY